ncbi:hypothetical protein Droror1_Dr00017356 [Drosera rotundifolia]
MRMCIRDLKSLLVNTNCIREFYFLIACSCVILQQIGLELWLCYCLLAVTYEIALESWRLVAAISAMLYLLCCCFVCCLLCSNFAACYVAVLLCCLLREISDME